MAKKTLFKKNNSLEACDVCKSTQNKDFRIIGKQRYAECLECGTIYSTTRHLNSKSPETYLDDPEGYLSIINPEGTRYMAGEIDHAYSTKVGKPQGRLLEIGSGLGMLSYTLYSRGWDTVSLELSKPAAEWARKVFKLPVDTSLIEDYRLGGDQFKFNCVVMVEVIEHFYNIQHALKSIKKILKRGGMLFGTTPNIDSEHWKISKQDIYDPTDHIVLFNKESLKKILEDNGFKDVDVKFFGGGSKNDSNLMYSAIRK